MYPPLPQFQGASRRREVDETQEERERVAFDTLQLMFCEDLKTGLRLQDLPVSGLKDDLARRLSVPLMSSEVNQQANALRVIPLENKIAFWAVQTSVGRHQQQATHFQVDFHVERRIKGD